MENDGRRECVKTSTGKYLKVLLFLVGILVLFFSGSTKAEAKQKVNQMQILIQLDQQGNAHITENWNVTMTKGTEIYKTFVPEKQQKVNNFSVAMDGVPFKRDPYWDINGDLGDKAFMYGNNKGLTNNKFELNWGATRMGTHDYQIKYDVSNFVIQTKTAQMILWEFVAQGQKIFPKNISVTIEDPHYKFSPQKGNGIWGFGFSGKTSFKNGRLYTKNTIPLLKKDRVKLLVKLPPNLYGTHKVSRRTFASYAKEAFSGSGYTERSYHAGRTFKHNYVLILLKYSLFKIVFAFIIVLYYRKKYYHQRYPSFGNLQTRNEHKYEADIPADNIFQLYIFYEMFVGNEERIRKNFIKAALLEMVRKKYIKLKQIEKRVQASLFTEDTAESNEEIVFVLTANGPDEQQPRIIRQMTQILLEIGAKQNGIIRQKDITRYFDLHAGVLMKLSRELYSYSKEYLLENNLVKDIEDLPEIKDKKALKREERFAGKHKGLVLTDQGIVVLTKLARLKNYLDLLSEAKKRGKLPAVFSEDPAHFDKLMIIAVTFNMLDDFEKGVKAVYPDYRKLSLFYQLVLRPILANYNMTNRAHDYDSFDRDDSFFGGGDVGGSSGGSSGGGGFR